MINNSVQVSPCGWVLNNFNATWLDHRYYILHTENILSISDAPIPIPVSVSMQFWRYQFIPVTLQMPDTN